MKLKSFLKEYVNKELAAKYPLGGQLVKALNFQPFDDWYKQYDKYLENKNSFSKEQEERLYATAQNLMKNIILKK